MYPKSPPPSSHFKVPEKLPLPLPKTPYDAILRIDINFTKCFGVEIRGFQMKECFTLLEGLGLGHPV